MLTPDKEALKRAFGQALQTMRRERRLTQEDLSAASDCHATYVSLLERGVKLPSLATVFAMADALGYQPEELVQRVRERLRRTARK